jgi:hypothetical protein
MTKPKKTKQHIEYPFIIMGPRSRLVKVKGPKYSNALSRALALYPNKYLKTQYAKRMDLVDAQDEAKKLSLKSAHKQFVVLLQEGDFEVENQFSLEPKADIYACFYKGKKIDTPETIRKFKDVEEAEPKVAKSPRKGEVATEKEIKSEVNNLNRVKLPIKMKKELPKKASAKVEKMVKAEKGVAKKVAAPKKEEKGAAKKVAAKKEQPAKKVTAKKASKEDGKSVSISTKDMIKNIAKGYAYYTVDGQRKGESTLAKRPDQDTKHDMVEVKPA